VDTVRSLAQDARAWPFEEARKVLARVQGATPAPEAPSFKDRRGTPAAPDKGYVLFETGYGPSGLPHIGTFGEVVRTTMVRHAFGALCDIPSKLFAFSDDMDGLRKVPDNVPNQALLAQHLGKPLTSVPDPFGTHESFGHHNNARLRAFLDQFGFEYEFQSATECYRSGRFDTTLLRVLQNYEAVIGVILPTLGPERRATYSPFLPICPKTGIVLQRPVIARDTNAGTVTYEAEDGTRTEVPVTGGHCKLQWKADWAMRWAALDVDYEMSGKDLIDSVRLSSRICAILGGRPPEGFTYELFLDEAGEKISKSRGNGLTVEEWLRYAPDESLQLYMYNSPRKAKRLYFDVIPRHVDDYLTYLAKFAEEDEARRLENPVWHIHDGAPPAPDPGSGSGAGGHVTFALLLNLASACNSEDPAVLWGFISRYVPGAAGAPRRSFEDGASGAGAPPQTAPILSRLVAHAINYYRDFVKPNKRYRAPDANERAALADLASTLEALPGNADAEAIQNEVYEVGKRHAFEDLRAWFRALYEILLGRDQGPRMGSFIALYGKEETLALIRRVLAGEDISQG
jgi:lysyl-tRNA synthetase class 1